MTTGNLPSFFDGPIPSGLSLTRCSTCDKPLLYERADTSGRCETCTARNARAVDCDCGFLYEGERHTCCCSRCGGANEAECTCADDDAYVDSIDSLGLRGLLGVL